MKWKGLVVPLLKSKNNQGLKHRSGLRSISSNYYLQVQDEILVSAHWPEHAFIDIPRLCYIHLIQMSSEIKDFPRIVLKSDSKKCAAGNYSAKRVNLS